MSKHFKIIIPAVIFLLVSGTVYFIYKWRSHTSDSHLSVVPKNAAAVFKIDIKNLAVKADPAKMLNQPAFKNATGTISELISDPFATGIDPIENIYGFIAKEGDHQAAAIVFNVDDAEKLKDFVNKLHISANEPINESGIYFSEISGTKCIAWNDNAGMMIATSGGEAKADAQKYLLQAKENSIVANPDYKTFSDKNFDMGLFFNNKELSNLSGTMNSFSPLGLTDGHGELILNFENEKISAVYNNYPVTQNTNSLLKSGGISSRQLDAIAPSTPLLYLGLSADFNAILSALKSDPGMKDNLTAIEMGMNTSEKELKNLLTGDVSISFTDFKDISSYDPRVEAQVLKMMNEPGADRSDYALNTPMCYISIGENNDVKMDSILSTSGLSKINNFYAMPGIMYIAYLAVKDGHLLITNDYFGADALAKTGKLSAALPSQIKNSDPLVFWADLNPEHLPLLTRKTMEDMCGKETWQFYLTALQPFQNIHLSGKRNGSELNITVAPGEGNSLYRLLNYYGDLLN